MRNSGREIAYEKKIIKLFYIWVNVTLLHYNIPTVNAPIYVVVLFIFLFQQENKQCHFDGN